MTEVFIETIPLDLSDAARAARECELAEFISNAQDEGITVVIEVVEAHSGGDSYIVRVDDV